MSSTLRTLYVSFAAAACTCTLAWPFHVHAQAIERKANGVTLHSSSGTLRVSVCSDGVIRVEAGLTEEFPNLSCPP